jgi:ABC-type antimicrobial peptide transport system permease subunit
VNNTFELPKKSLSIFVNPETSPLEISRLTNRLIQIAGENNVFGFNVNKFVDDLKSRMFLITAISWIIALVLFLMTFFQITVSVQASLKEDSQELGVLRAIGLQKSAVVRVSLYETLSTLVGAMFLGTLIGLFSAGLIALLFITASEMPVVLNIPQATLLAMLLMSLFTVVIGTVLGARGITKKSITSILRG